MVLLFGPCEKENIKRQLNINGLWKNKQFVDIVSDTILK